MILVLQIDTYYLVETQTNLSLIPHAFSMRNRLFEEKELVTMLPNNKSEHLGMRHNDRLFKGIICLASCMGTPLGSNNTRLGR